MTAIKVYFEIGHEASLRSKKTPEGFTHDWEVFVRGQEGADISNFVEKVVFHLHETFPKPRRVVKEPPFSIKESGYAGFMFPIELYLKNKDEPKKIKFSYDFTLQQSGFLKDRYVFHNPSEDFKKKLLKGGGIIVSNNAFYTNPDQETRSRDSFIEEKQLVNKSKIFSESVKKQKLKEHKEEISHKSNSSFENLFGPPLQKPPKVSPDPKKNEKNTKIEKKEKPEIEKKPKHGYKEIKQEKIKSKEEKAKQEKSKHHKEPDKIKEKNNKKLFEGQHSPSYKKKSASPKRPTSPLTHFNNTSNNKDDKVSKQASELFYPKKIKNDVKTLENKDEKNTKQKKKKDKKDHDRDKEKRDKKDHKKDHKSRDSPKDMSKEITKDNVKPKEKESPISKDKSKLDKPINKFSIENLKKTPPTENDNDNFKSKEKTDPERKHKHKKKDKKRDESRDKQKESSKDKKHRHEKHRVTPIEKPDITEQRSIPVKEPLQQESASPISVDTASQCSSKSGQAKVYHISVDDANSNSDSDSSVIVEEDDKGKAENHSPATDKHRQSSEMELEEIEPEPVPQKDKVKKHKDKSKKEEKRRKRKIAHDENEDARKIAKTVDTRTSNDTDHGDCSGTTSTETKLQDNGVSSSLGEDAESGELSVDYMLKLRTLQQKIMTIKSNDDLERVVNLIAETGRYEITTATFDFDLCLLDRTTVQQLIELVG